MRNTILSVAVLMAICMKQTYAEDGTVLNAPEDGVDPTDDDTDIDLSRLRRCRLPCRRRWIGDGECDKACNNPRCMFDGGDCLNTPSPTFRVILCPAACQRVRGDGVCDRICNRPLCDFDGGDCATPNPTTRSPTTKSPTFFTCPSGEGVCTGSNGNKYCCPFTRGCCIDTNSCGSFDQKCCPRNAPLMCRRLDNSPYCCPYASNGSNTVCCRSSGTCSANGVTCGTTAGQDGSGEKPGEGAEKSSTHPLLLL